MVPGALAVSRAAASTVRPVSSKSVSTSEAAGASGERDRRLRDCEGPRYVPCVHGVVYGGWYILDRDVDAIGVGEPS